MSVEVRPFRRDDRDQLTALVNAHIAAVVPGGSVSVARLLSQLEREPGEFIVDPWVRERATLVAVQRGRVVAGAHLLRYAAGEDVGASYREAAEIRWFLFWPEAPYWPDSVEAADTLLAACVAQLDRWGAPRRHADGTLPHPGVYGVPEQWPHVRAAYARAGFAQEDGGRVETVFVARVDELRRPVAPPLPELVAIRTLGINGTRLSATLNGDVVGYLEVEILDEGERQARADRLADVANLHVPEPHRRRGIGTWLVAQAADWLRLARVDRVLAYAGPEDDEHLGPFLEACGFRLLTRTERSWTRMPPGASGT
jgi:GNAT superfamily N-acetyltransferase